MKMTCYPNSLDGQTVHSAKPWKKKADGRQIKAVFI